MSENRTAYDLIPYTSHSFPQSHPTRLAAVAKLFGMHAPAVQNCRVLELGCAMGGNLIAMAQSHPGAQFIGIDSSSRQIAEGWKNVDRFGLKNIRLRQLDILDVPDDFGEFDYIISHGVFSWVPHPVQDRMLELCRRHLARDGVAYFSYNTYPGWHIRGIVRDMMLYRGQQFADPAMRLSQAKALVEFVAQSARSANDPYRQLLKTEFAGLGDNNDYYLHHEHLEENNHPIYFHEFARKLGVNGLQYLGESDVSTMVSTNFAPDIAKTLNELGAHDIVQMEQYMDFVRCRYFRETLVCHSAVRLERKLQPAIVKGMLLGSQANPESSAPNSEVEIFRTPTGHGIQCRSGIIKSGLRELLRRWPIPVPFSELYAICTTLPPAATTAETAVEEAFFATELLACMAAGVVEWHATPPPYTEAGDKHPATIPSARHQAEFGGAVFNLRGEPVELDIIHRRLLQHLDGSRDRAELTDTLFAFVTDGGHELRREDGSVVSDHVEMHAVLNTSIEQALQNFARHALLVRAQ